MAETLLSPGVLARENDQSFITQGPITAGAAIIGPAVKGPVGIPTLVTSYSDYLSRFGSTFISGGSVYSYFTSLAAYNYFNNGGETLLVTRVVTGSFTPATSNVLGLNGGVSFQLETLNTGILQNNSGSEVGGGLLASGSTDNVRWEVVGPTTGSGAFTLLIRQGNDTTQNKSVLETWTNLSLDPLAPNYIESVIGNQAFDVQTDPATGAVYVETTGTYTNKSRYVRVKSVSAPTPNYLDNNGNVSVASYTGSIPQAASGAFSGAVGQLFYGQAAFNENITLGTNVQGIPATAYTESIALLGNQDNYQFNVISTPGLTLDQGASQTVIAQLVAMCETRGDAMAIIDTNNYGANIGTVIANSSVINSSYAAAYWPWLQVQDVNSGKAVWTPASTMIPGVYAYNDAVSEPWFAPAGINRGGLATVIQAERKVAQSDRDTLYLNKINPIATFPNTGVVVYGQKTLQKAASALDRVNVRRLLIALKGFISQVALNLVFEQNTAVTRNVFLSQVNPYLSSVQQRQGLFAFKVVMDDTNNTADVIDRNQLVGQIYIQPTRTAEYILLDFNILPTGATFPS